MLRHAYIERMARFISQLRDSVFLHFFQVIQAMKGLDFGSLCIR